jgi:hypothetical protein
MLSALMVLVNNAPALLGDAEAAYAAIQAFLATNQGQDLEKYLATLFTHTVTPGAAVVSEPKA